MTELPVKYAIEVHGTEDWGDGAVHETGYDFTDTISAENEAVRFMKALTSAGIDEQWVGAHVTSNDADRTDSGDPSIEYTIWLRNGELEREKGAPLVR